MRKKLTILIFLLLFCLGLISCNNAANNKMQNLSSDEYLEGLDDQSYFSNNDICHSESGYYFYKVPYLYFFDEQSKETVKVCGLPNCTHDNRDCNAYLDPAFYIAVNIWYYDGNLYVIGKEENDRYSHYLYQISEDGSERKQICYLYNSADDSSDCELIIHRGYAYYVNINDDDISNELSTLYRINLEAVSEPEVVYEYTGIGANIYRIRGYGQYIYFQAGSFQDIEGNRFHSSLYRIGYQSTESEIVAKDLFTKDYLVIKNNLYYFNDDYNLFQRDLDTQDETTFYQAKERSFLSYDGKHIYIDSGMGTNVNQIDFTDRFLEVLDLEGNTIDRISLAGIRSCYYGDDNYLFIEYEGIINAFDKTQLGTSKQDWILLQ